jgi:hypothetical protein
VQGPTQEPTEPEVQMPVQGPAVPALEQAARAMVVQAAQPRVLAQDPRDADCTSGGSPGVEGPGRPLAEVVWPLVEQGRQPPEARGGGSRGHPTEDHLSRLQLLSVSM